MIIPKRIKIYNYSQIANIEVDLDEGIYFITGENRDELRQASNGAGKSLFCSTIVWALFEDILRRGVKRDDIIGDQDVYTMVEVEFEVEGREVVVTRYRNHPEHKNNVYLKVDGSDLTHATKKRETELLIERTLNINKDILYHCAFSHARGEPLVALTSTDLNRVVSQILDTDRYDDWIKEVRAKIRELERESYQAQSNLSSLTQVIESHKQEAGDIRSQIEQFVISKADKVGAIEEDIKTVKSEIEDFNTLLEGEEETLARYEELKKVDQYVSNLNVKVQNREREVANDNKNINVAMRRLAEAEANMISVKERLNNLVHNPTGVCDACGNMLSDSKDIEKRIKDYQDQFNKLEVKRADRNSALVGLKDRLKMNKSLLKRDQEQVNKYREQLEEYHEVKQKIEAFARAKNYIKKCEERLKTLNKRLKEAQKETSEGLKKMFANKTAQIEQKEAELGEVKDSIDSLSVDIEAARVLENSLRSVKASRFNSFILDFQEIVNHHLQQMTDDDYHCILEEDGEELSLRFTSASKKGEYYHYDVFSQGEQARISKAASTALNTMMNLGFIIDDEGLNGLDDPGIESVLEFVLKANEGKVFFFVGHQKALHDYFKDATNLHLIKENGITRLEVR